LWTSALIECSPGEPGGTRSGCREAGADLEIMSEKVAHHAAAEEPSPA
jgi:hypothetical protein